MTKNKKKNKQKEKQKKIWYRVIIWKRALIARNVKKATRSNKILFNKKIKKKQNYLNVYVARFFSITHFYWFYYIYIDD